MTVTAHPTAPATETKPRYEAFWRFPHLSKRWKSAGTFATEAEATAAIDEFLRGRTYRAVDRWVHRVVESESDTNSPESPP